MQRRIRIASLLAIAFLVTACADPGGGADSAAGSRQDAPATSRLAGLLGSADMDSYALALEPIEFSFPEDHAAHPAFRNEWWYVTGNLDADNGDRFGFELTIFRFTLSPDGAVGDSAWRTDQIYIGHFAVTDASREAFYASQRYARGAAGLAGAQSTPFRVWLEDWSLESLDADGPDSMPWRLRAAEDEFGIDLVLDAMKAPVLNGDRGLSRKSAAPGNASYYYSMTRLKSRGSLRVGDRSFDVAGLSWLDREWSSSALAPDQAGWDWFALQFDDDTELMFYRLRNLDGSAGPFSAGSFIRADGSKVSLGADDVSLEVLGRWENGVGDLYPVAWRMQVPSVGLDVEITPVLEDQELNTTVRYWEGAVDVRVRGSTVGRGYVELTGYSE